MADTEGIGPVLPPWPVRDTPGRPRRKEESPRRQRAPSPRPADRRRDDDRGGEGPRIDEYA